MYTTLIQVTANAKRPWQPTWLGIDHVQLAMPVGREDVAREFYAGVLGIPEVPKPAALAVRGGCWFESGAVRVHVGAEEDFRPARKAHPALVVADLPAVVERLGLDVTWADDAPGIVRCHVADPFGNRIELIDGGRA
jgi:catechol 2,3-dioxygenase-like lactoylglutathione lyase family enzyme